MKHRIFAAVAVLFVAAAAILIPAVVLPRLQSRPGRTDRRAEEIATGIPATEQAIGVLTEESRIETLRSYVRLPAEIKAATSVEVFADTGGTLRAVSVQVGERVTSNQILAHVDPSRPGSRFEPSPVRAPVAATVTGVHRDIGDRIATSTPLFRLETLSDLEIVVSVPERYLAAVHSRTTADLSVAALGDRSVGLEIKRISPVLDPVRRSKEVTFRPGATARGIEPGMFGEVRLLIVERRDALTVPTVALLTRDAREVVYVVEDEWAVERQVQTGLIVSGRVEITAGLNPGDVVAVSGHQQLEDARAVRSGGGQ